MTLKLVITLALAFLMSVFVLQNTTVVEIRFLFWTLSMSRALLIVLLLVIGMVLGWLARSLRVMRHKR